ncbi:MAG: membrane protein insertase YidC [Salinispira sp.]
MDRNTIIAIVLSTIVLVIGFFVQTVFFSPQEEILPNSFNDAQDTIEDDNESSSVRRTALEQQFLVYENDQPSPSQREIVYTQEDFLQVVMDTRGGNIKEIVLLGHEDNGKALQFFFGSADADAQGLTLTIGGIDGALLDPVFYFRESADEYEFYQDIVVPDLQEEPFQIIKRYRFFENEYFFEMEIEFKNSVNQYIPMDVNGTSYTVSVGPQIGPEFTELSNNGRTDFRRFSYFESGTGRRKDIRNLSPGESETLKGYIPWAGVNGKYFVALAIPGNTGADIVFTTYPTDSGIQGNQLHLVRPKIESSRISDVYRFYFGPKSVTELRKYENAEDNQLGISELGIDKLVESSWLSWLENILKSLMNFFYGVIPNWGVSIILLTILVKLVLYPLTRKSFESTARMKELAPKIEELKKTYQDDAQKLNQATMELYKKKKVNPLGGCLPMLLQFPFFIAMFSLFNNNFELRGATFIPGWITDLSIPEAIVNFNFTIPLLNWDALRALPIIFLVSQFFTMKLTQPADSAQSNAQMKIMSFGLPVMFFFIMYNMPSGLLIYWIFQNIISTGQQLAYNYFTHKKAQKESGSARSKK